MKRLKLEIQGLVQGVGFRPFIFSLAQKFGLYGFVTNSSLGVHVQIQGEEKEIKAFLHELSNSLPPLSRVDKIEQTYMKVRCESDFSIKKSENSHMKSTAVIPDLAICDECLGELRDKKNRRFAYPFINCTNCGPRYSIIGDIPYDRPFTSMAKFTMCKECQKEYENPLNRRYHAQPISCKNCGPTLCLHVGSKKHAHGVIEKTAQMIKNGKIVAIKGVGGFHLVCDATNSKVIGKLRDFKIRPTKPFAVMCANLKMAKEYVCFDTQEEKTLTSIEKPIVLIKKRASLTDDLIAPHTDRLGIFLPNTPLHELLFDFLNSPIIATSANAKGEPIITKKEDLDDKFGEILSGVLDYDREILHPCDDSVVQMVGENRVFLRVSRGISPLTLPFQGGKKTSLAVGGQEKNAIAFYFNERIVLSPYLGGMDSVKTFELFLKTIEDWKRFYGLDFDKIICDNHPNYTTTKWAKSQKTKVVSVNHYHAHILATLIDQKISLNTKVLGVAWDGTGYGDDGTIWGGEFLVVEGKSYERVVHFKPFKLLGGEKSVKNIDRIAYSMLLDLGIDGNEFEQINFLSQMHQKDINSPLCSSVGRLFDAVCYLATGLKEVSYDGESGLILESLYDESIKEAYPLHVKNGVIEYDKMLLEILKDRQQSKNYRRIDNSKLIASKFLNALADIVVHTSNMYDLPIILGGGVFQNKTLLKLLEKKAKLPIYYPQTLTPNDGSLCVGQIAYELST